MHIFPYRASTKYKNVPVQVFYVKYDSAHIVHAHKPAPAYAALSSQVFASWWCFAALSINWESLGPRSASDKRGGGGVGGWGSLLP